MRSLEADTARVRGITIACAMLTSSVCLACSGPHALQRIRDNTSRSWVCFWITVATALLAGILSLMTRYQDWRLAWAALLVPVHPGWWMSSTRGDCGTDRFIGSVAVTGLSVVFTALYVAK